MVRLGTRTILLQHLLNSGDLRIVLDEHLVRHYRGWFTLTVHCTYWISLVRLLILDPIEV